MTSSWDDEDDPDGEYIPVRVFFDERTQKWACRCLLYEHFGKCLHLTRYRRQIELDVKEEYL